MGKPKIFTLVFNQTQGRYFPGQIISGKVVIELDKPMKMRGIRLEMAGDAIVGWSEYRTRYITREIYFKEIIGLFGSATESTVMPVGTYEYPFNFLLPRATPASFEGGIGNIRYLAKAVVDIPFAFDHVVSVSFFVLPFLDLNREPASLKRKSVMQKYEIISNCCSSGTIAVNIYLNRSGFIPGETILISGQIVNHTNENIKKTRAVLLQNLLFHNPRRSNTRTWREKGSVTRGAIEAGQMDNWDKLQITVPDVPASRLDGCRIIDIRYHLKFIVSMQYNSVTLSNEVVIGTIPLIGVNQSIVQQPQPAQMNQNPPVPFQPPASAPRPPVPFQPPASAPRPPVPVQPPAFAPRPPVPVQPPASAPSPPVPVQPLASAPRPPVPVQSLASAPRTPASQSNVLPETEMITLSDLVVDNQSTAVDGDQQPAQVHGGADPAGRRVAKVETRL